MRSCRRKMLRDRGFPLHPVSSHRLLATALVAVASVVLYVPAGQAQPATNASAGRTAAVAPAGGPAWPSLTPAQRAALLPLERDWASMDAPRKTKWLDIAARFPRMPADEQKRVQERMAEWARMTPIDRGQARMNFRDAKQLSSQERQARWQAYQALPDTDRKALVARAAASAPRESSPAISPSAAAAWSKQPPVSDRAKALLIQPIAPTVVQGKPGATTLSIAKPATPPAHQQPGQPRIASKSAQVDRVTLLPRNARLADAGAASAPKPGP